MRVAVEERLAAILAAEVCDYDRLLEHGRADAIATLQLQHHEVIDAAIAVYGGRIFELEDDHTLAEFASPLAAVRCAVDIQENLRRRNAALAPDAQVQLRIGIHYSEIMVDRGDPQGEPVTIAHRVMRLAAPGEVAVSRTVLEQVRKRVEHGFEDLAGIPGRRVPRANLAFRLNPAPAHSLSGPPGWLATAGRLALTALLAAAVVWLAMTGGGPGR